ITTYPASLIATVDTLVNGGNTYLDLDVSVNSFSPYYTSSTNYFSDVSGNVASQAELTSAYISNGAWADSPGQDYPSYNNAIQTALALIVADGLPVPGSFQLTNSACHAASTINYSLGPNLFFSESDTLQAFTQAQPGQYPYYLGTLNGGPYCGTTPSVVNFPGAH